MPYYENMMVTITLFLFFVNGVFIFGALLPGSETGNGQLINIGVSQKDINDMNNRLHGIVDSSGVFIPSNTDINAAYDVTGQQKNYLTLFQQWLFGGLDTLTLGLASKAVGTLSILGTLISLFAATFFGYLFWIDLFINPLWGSGFAAINLVIKAFLFIVQMLWIFQIMWQIFFAGTGTRG